MNTPAISVYNYTYHDDNGNKISYEEHCRLFDSFQRELDREYNLISDAIIDLIPKNASQIEKLKILYSYFVNYFDYDYDAIKASNIRPDLTINGKTYKFKNWNSLGIASHEKYAPIICKKSICAGFSDAFKDLSNKIGIPCEIVGGYTSLAHAWNVVLINGEPRHIDVTYGIYQKNKKLNIMNYFLTPTNELKKIGGHHDFEDSLNRLLSNLKPKITIRNSEAPKITILNNEAPKITILNSNDISERTK